MLRGGGRDKLMRRVITIALFVVIFLAGFSVLLYPVISDYLNSLKHIRTVAEYIQAVESLSEDDYTEILKAAHEYNDRLRSKSNRFIMTEEELAEYNSLLDPTGLGVIGTLYIEAIDIYLPIFHGTNESVLQVGLGHLEGSSLPVGGPGTHAVITGHRGLPSSTLLSNLDRLVYGDTFNVRVLGETLIYRVDQITVVLPNETGALSILPDEDHCTLVTCTPYSINTHRMLVRGYRVDGNAGDEFVRPSRIPAEARIFTGARAALLLIVPAMLTELTILFIRLRRVYGRGKKR